MKKILLVLCCLLLSGCMTLINHGKEVVHITTPSVTQASCSLYSYYGHWLLVNSPGYVEVHRSITRLYIQCSKYGYDPSSAVIHARFNPLTIPQLAVPGGSAFFLFDNIYGSAYSYPSEISIPMRQL